MTLHVASARVTYRGPDRLDVTRKSGCALGRLFAPSWAILRPALDARALAKAITHEAKRAAALPETMIRPSEWDLAREAEAIEAAAWEAYVPAFLEEMRQSYRRHRAAWEAFLARERATIVCYCADPTHCHRAILRAVILPKLGAIDEGELAA